MSDTPAPKAAKAKPPLTPPKAWARRTLVRKLIIKLQKEEEQITQYLKAELDK